MKLVILDGNAILHRSFHALPPLKSKSGEEMQGVYGFLLVLCKVLKELSPTHVACAFDLKAPTFRTSILKEYKAHRPSTPSSLIPQIQYAKDAVSAFGIPVFSKEGFEADDVIATLVKCALQKDKSLGEVVIVTGDTDMLQLVEPFVSVYLLRRGVKDVVLYNAKSVQEKYGLSPRQLVDLKALKGDPSDNIKGVPGIGEKRAQELVERFSDVEHVLEAAESNSSDIPEKVCELLVNHKEEAVRSKTLVKVRNDVPLECDFSQCELSKFPRENVEALFAKFGFSSFQKRISDIEKSYGKDSSQDASSERKNATLFDM